MTEVRYIVSAAGWRQRAKYDIFLICVVLWLNSGGAYLLERRYKDLKGFIMNLLKTCMFCIKKHIQYMHACMIQPNCVPLFSSMLQ